MNEFTCAFICWVHIFDRPFGVFSRKLYLCMAFTCRVHVMFIVRCRCSIHVWQTSIQLSQDLEHLEILHNSLWIEMVSGCGIATSDF